MGVTGTVVIYLILGGVVAGVLALREGVGVQILGWVVLWPIYAPFAVASEPPAAPGPRPPTPAGEPLRAAVCGLRSALTDLAPGDLFGAELAQVDAVGAALGRSESRLAELEALLGSPPFQEAAVAAALGDCERRHGAADPRTRSVRARLRNIGRLQRMRDAARAELEGAALKLEEVSSQVRLLAFSEGAPDEVGALLEELSALMAAC
jgi:hypothetical protein